jgi:phosphodiesterase/alkaline phosphatase D-like protein
MTTKIFKKSNLIKKLDMGSQAKVFWFTIMILAIIGCSSEKHNPLTFMSDFEGIETRTWIGPEYWSNPMQDWQVSNDKIECLVSNENRNIHLLTNQLGSNNGDLEMSIQLGFINLSESQNNKNWAGFSIGSKGKFDDYRDNAIYGKGINIGISSNGSIFIGDPSMNRKNDTILKLLSHGVLLKVTAVPYKDFYSINFSVHDIETGHILANISKQKIAKEELIGDLVLVSNFESLEEGIVNNTKSVWFKNWKIKGSKVSIHNDRTFGPIMFSQYTLSRNILKLTAQLAPIDTPEKEVLLQIKENGNWKTIANSKIDGYSRTASFKIANWDDTKEFPYRLVYNLNIAKGLSKDYYWEGIIRKNPKDKEEIVVAGFTGNNDLGFPNTDIVKQVKYQNPDLLFFSGDQIYEEVGGYDIQREPLDIATLDYLRKWYMFGWAYRDILKDRPTICLVDDHDVYMGNIWGESGKATIQEGSKKDIQDSGGYRMPPEWVNMVQRTQTSHLPTPFDDTPVKRNIGVYYTQMNYGDISFAILEDRKFKSAPKPLLPEANVINGWPQNKAFKMIDANVLQAELLGQRQLDFLEIWAKDWSYGAEMKTVLSQTIFANVATLPKEAMSDVVVPTLRILNKGDYAENDFPVTDMDSNGWPQKGRNNALQKMRKAFAFHLAGDQHLGSVIQYGTDHFNDAGYAFCVPSISNYWPRRWYPKDSGDHRKQGTPLYTGDFKDGFGNKITVIAVSNPLFTNKRPSELYDRAAGYGIVRFNKKERTIKVECWPRGASPEKGDSEQYDGWPITINQTDNFCENSKLFLPVVKVIGLTNPVVQIIDQSNNEVVYTLRIKGIEFKPKVLKEGTYKIKVGEPDKNLFKEINNVSSSTETNSELKFVFN